MNPRYPVTSARAFHRCEYCRAPEAVFNFPFEVEHIVPRAQGGSDTEDNWALSCRSCNLFKSDCRECVDPESGVVTPLFHPRVDQWGEHFEIDLTAGIVVGLTPVGRATAGRLRMNSLSQTEARRQWIRLGLFP